MNETKPNFDSVWEILERNSVLQAENSKQIQELKASQAETSKQIKGLEVTQAKTDKKLNKIAVLLGGIGNNQGDDVADDFYFNTLKADPELIDLHLDYIEKMTAKNYKKLEDDYEILMNESDVFIAEEFYFNTLKANPELKGLRFDYIEKNVTRSHNKLEDEFDILMVNSSDVFIIEVKYKAHESDLERLLNKKAVNFKKLYPKFSGYQHHLGLATFHINDELREKALKKGVTVLQRKGKLIETWAA